VVERVGWVIEVATVPIGLAPVSGRVEHHGVKVHPATVWRGEFHSYREPVSLDVVSTAFEGRDRGSFVIGVNSKIHVTMRTRLVPDEGVDSPPASEPDATTGPA
jgi:hypothetical protein